MPTKLILISASKLGLEDIDAIITGMGLIRNSDLVIENKVDPSILAGVIIKYDGYYLDLSVKSKLNDIVYNLS